MAKVKLTGHASGTGIFTVTAPNSSTDRTITLPDNTGSLLTSSDVAAAVEAASDSNTFTSADNTKLDGIEASADVTDATNVTAAGALMDSEVTNLAEVKAFDASDYATAAQGTTADAALPKAGGTITGAVYHGTNNFGNDSGDFMNWTTNTRLDITVHANNEFRFEADGDFHADGDVIAYSTTTASDRKLKDNITTIEDALDKVKQLNGVEFTWKKDGKKSAGVIAQDVEKVLPQAVKTVNDLNTDEEYKTVKYDALTSILIESIKELSARIEELENK